MKRRKNKGAVVAIVASLSTVSLVSVGFAAWLITGGDTATASGVIEVETVTDQRYLLRADNNGAPAAGNTGITFADNIVFGPKADTSVTNPWLKFETGEGTHPENLTATALIWVGNAAGSSVSADGHGLEKGGETILQLYQAVASGDAYETNKDSHYLAELPVPTIAATSTAVSDAIDGVVYKQYELTIQFNWGSFFTYNEQVVNPYTYYNKTYTGAAVTLEVTSAAKSVLESILTVNSTTYTVAIKTGNLID